MKNKIVQYFLIIAILSGLTGGWFYFSSNAAQKINSSKVTNLTSGLVGYWTFDGADMTATQALDKAGSNTGTLEGTAKPIPTAGKIGQALYFDGVNEVGSRVTKISASGLPVVNSSFSLSAWINFPNAIGGGGRVIAGWGGSVSGSGPYGYQLGVAASPNKLRHWFPDGTSLTANTTLNSNTWYHAIVTYDGITRKIYLNGSLDCTPDTPLAQAAIGADFFIGYYALNENYIKSTIDEVRIYSRALSASEITELYQQGQAKINASEAGKVTNGLKLYYTMDGADINWTTNAITNRGSLGGSGGTMTNITQATGPAIGKIGQALDFNGASSYIDTNETSNLNLTGDLTASAWIYRDTSSTTDFIFSKWDGSHDPARFQLAANSSKLNYVHIIESVINVSISSVGDVPTGVWTHVAVARDQQNSQVLFYINGVAETWQQYTSTTLINNDAQSMKIGTRGTPLNYFDGKIDEFRLYDRVLSQSEVTELYQQGQTKINASQTGKLTSGLVGHWTFDGNNISGTAVTDSSGNSNTGEIGNATATIGKIGQGLKFDSSTDYVSVADPGTSSLDITTGEMTIATWMKLDSLDAIDSARIVSRGNTTFRLTLDDSTNCDEPADNQYELYFWFMGMVGCTSVDTITQANKWYHVVAMRSATQGLLFYVDGSQVTTAYPGGAYLLGDSSNPVYIGNMSTNSATNRFPGALDEVRIYNRALSPSEVTELHNMGR